MRTRRLALLAATVVLALAGCSSNPGSSTSDIRANPPVPAGVQDPAVIPSAGPAGGPATCRPEASLRPAGALPAAGSPMPAGSLMETIQRRGRLIVGVDQNTYLFGYRNPKTGTIEGFDIDMASYVAQAIFGTATGHVQLVAITAAQRIPYVSTGKVDIVADTMTMNCERWKQVSFSSQYYAAGQRVLVPASSKVKEIEDLAGQKVCAAAGSTSIVNIATNKAKLKPVAVKDWTDCLVMLQQGQVAAISTDDTILAGLQQQDPTTKMVGRAFTSEPYGMAIDKNHPEFVRFVNAVLEQIRPQAWGQTYARWLGSPVPAPPPAVYQDAS
jgi:polar amino acid transport system substrate-binding protein